MAATPEDMRIEDGVLMHVTDEYVKSQNGHLEIPSDVTKINKLAFCLCRNLLSATIPNSVTEIGDYTFSGCTNLRSLTIPDSVTVGGYAFASCGWTIGPCANLKSIRINTSEPSTEKAKKLKSHIMTDYPRIKILIGDEENTHYHDSKADKTLDFLIQHPALIAGVVGALVCVAVIVSIASMGIGGVGIIAGAGAIAIGVGANIGLSAAASAIAATAITGITAGLVSSGLTFFGLKTVKEAVEEIGHGLLK